MALHIEKLHEYTGHRGSLFALAVDEDQGRAYTSGDDGVVAAWQLDQQDDQGEGILQVGNGIYALQLLPEFGWLAVGASDGTIRIIDLANKQERHSYRKTTEAIFGMAYEPGRRYLWILHGGGYLSVLRLPDFEEMGFVRMAQEHLRSIWLDEGGDRLFLGASDNRILVLDRHDASLINAWAAHDNSVFALAMHPQGRYLLSGGRDAHLNVWDARAPFSSLQKIPAHNFTVNAICFSPDGRHFLTGSRDKTIKLWDADTWQLLKVIDFDRYLGHRHSVNRLHWLHHDQTVISVSDDRRVIRWRMDLD